MYEVPLDLHHVATTKAGQLFLVERYIGKSLIGFSEVLHTESAGRSIGNKKSKKESYYVPLCDKWEIPCNGMEFVDRWFVDQ